MHLWKEPDESIPIERLLSLAYYKAWGRRQCLGAWKITIKEFYQFQHDPRTLYPKRKITFNDVWVYRDRIRGSKVRRMILRFPKFYSGPKRTSFKSNHICRLRHRTILTWPDRSFSKFLISCKLDNSTFIQIMSTSRNCKKSSLMIIPCAPQVERFSVHS